MDTSSSSVDLNSSSVDPSTGYPAKAAAPIISEEPFNPGATTTEVPTAPEAFHPDMARVVPKSEHTTIQSHTRKVGNQQVDLLTSEDGDVIGFSVSPASKLYSTIDGIIDSGRLLALPVAERYALAGQVAALPAEHPRLVERLASQVATSLSEVTALNAIHVLDICQELVPGFKDAIPPERLQKAAEMSAHNSVQAAILLGEKPPEWEKAKTATAAPTTVMLLPSEPELEDKGLVYDVGRGVGTATKFVGGSVLGGVGLVSDTLGLTDNAELALVDTAEDAVDLIGDGANLVVDSLDEGLDGTREDIRTKGVVVAVGEGFEDAADVISDFVSDTVTGIGGGVHAILNAVVGTGDEEHSGVPETHKVAIVVSELFGEERSLGLRLENRLLTKFTRPEAEKIGWHLNDCVMGVGPRLVKSQEEMLAAIGEAKEALKSSGAPIRFLVERLGPKPTPKKRGDLVFVAGRAARVENVHLQSGTMAVRFQDDGSVVRVHC